jgi:hypothetical protein
MSTPARAPVRQEKRMPRLTIDLSESKHREISVLRDLGDLSTLRELVNSGLTLLKWAMVERSRGYKICSVLQTGEQTVLRELEMPALSAAARRPELADALESAIAPAVASSNRGAA